MSRLFWPILFFVVVGSALFVALAYQEPPSQQPTGPEILAPFSVSQAAPEALVSDKEGQSRPIDELLGSKTLVVFWSGQCGECRILLRELSSFIGGQPGMTVVLIAFRDTPEAAEVAMADYGVSLTTFFDRDGGAYQKWSATLPGAYYLEGETIQYFFPGRISTEHLDALLTL